MRGRIIHYNGNDGRGLIAADNRQMPFEIGNWRSDTAPAVNATVEVTLAGDAIEAVARIPEDVLLKEKASEIASRLGSAGGAALQSLNPPAATASAAGGLHRLGKPLLVAHAAFVLAAFAMPYLSFNPLGLGGRSFTLMGLSEASEGMGISVGGSFWTWLAILSIALPVLWRNRLAWAALLLPLVATLKPGIDIALAAAKATSALGNSFEASLQRQIAEQVIEMLQIGTGAWICLLSALATALIGLKRVLLPPAQ